MGDDALIDISRQKKQRVPRSSSAAGVSLAEHVQARARDEALHPSIARLRNGGALCDPSRLRALLEENRRERGVASLQRRFIFESLNL